VIWNEVLGTLLIFIGLFFLFVSGVGMYRMPDLYNRLQAATKTSTLGAISLLFGVMAVWTDVSLKLIVLMAFILLTSPITGHALARSGYISGVPLWEGTVVDTYAPACVECDGKDETANPNGNVDGDPSQEEEVEA